MFSYTGAPGDNVVSGKTSPNDVDVSCRTFQSNKFYCNHLIVPVTAITEHFVSYHVTDFPC